MALFEAINMLKFCDKIVGKKNKITINSNIYRHNIFDDDGVLDLAKDIYIIDSGNNTISINDIIKVFNKMEKQFIHMKGKNLDGRSYFFEGIEYNKSTKMYEIFWGS